MRPQRCDIMRTHLLIRFTATLFALAAMHASGTAGTQSLLEHAPTDIDMYGIRWTIASSIAANLSPKVFYTKLRRALNESGDERFVVLGTEDEKSIGVVAAIRCRPFLRRGSRYGWFRLWQKEEAAQCLITLRDPTSARGDEEIQVLVRAGEKRGQGWKPEPVGREPHAKKAAKDLQSLVEKTFAQ